jgi:CubicO group peptidase (beta-lactamase class C family)
MARFQLISASIGAVALALSSPAQGELKDARARFDRFVTALAANPAAPPGFAIVVVSGPNIVYSRAFGTRNAATGAPLRLDTPMYTASATKAWVGLLAARLDANDKFPLNTPMIAIWPDLHLPRGANPASITAAALLSHSSGIEDGGLGWRYGITGDYDPLAAPAHLSHYAELTGKPFQYGNFGPVVYTAMVQHRLGLDLRAQLRKFVFRPLGLRRTDISDDAFGTQSARCHTRFAGRWIPVRKPSRTMNAGGGVYTSPRDAARFLEAFTSRGATSGTTFAAAVLSHTYAPFAKQDKDFLGFKRWGYGLGWDLSTYDGEQVVSRSGGYAGCRTLMAFEPANGLGIIAFTVGDAGGNLLNVSLVQQAFDIWRNVPDAQKRAAGRIRGYAAGAMREMKTADQRSAPAFRPVPNAADYAGTYENPDLGRLTISVGRDRLLLRAGVATFYLGAQKGDSFETIDARTYEGPSQVRFNRRPSGAVSWLTLDDDVFVRVGR